VSDRGLHDRDAAFTDVTPTIAAMQIHEVLTAPRSPWQNAYVERLIGSIRRECLDHVIVLSGVGLQRVLADHIAYYMNTRTHLSLGKDAPAPRPVTKPSIGRIVEIPWSTGFIIATTVWLRSRWFEGSCSFIHLPWRIPLACSRGRKSSFRQALVACLR
jgi:hypothetical protein